MIDVIVLRRMIDAMLVPNIPILRNLFLLCVTPSIVVCLSRPYLEPERPIHLGANAHTGHLRHIDHFTSSTVTMSAIGM
jgi:hypothetical protein